MSYHNKCVYRSGNLDAVAANQQVANKIRETCGLKPVYLEAVISEVRLLMARVGDDERYHSLETFFTAVLRQDEAANTKSHEQEES